MDWRCEATAMDFAHFENYGSPVPPCDEPAEVEVQGYKLCAGCADALELLADLGLAARRPLKRV